MSEHLKASSDPLQIWQSSDAFVHIAKGSFRFVHREQPELKKAVARHRREKIRVAAPGVEHQPLGMTGSERDQSVLQLERAEFGHLAEVDAVHGTLGSRALPATALSWINAAVKKRTH